MSEQPETSASRRRPGRWFERARGSKRAKHGAPIDARGLVARGTESCGGPSSGLVLRAPKSGMVMLAGPHIRPRVPFEHADSPLRCILVGRCRCSHGLVRARPGVQVRGRRRHSRLPGDAVQSRQGVAQFPDGSARDHHPAGPTSIQHPAADVIREAPREERQGAGQGREGRQSRNAANAANAAERAHLRVGMTEAEVLARVGNPDVTVGTKGTPSPRWTYMPAPGDSGDDDDAAIQQGCGRRHRPAGHQEMTAPPARQHAAARAASACADPARAAKHA